MNALTNFDAVAQVSDKAPASPQMNEVEMVLRGLGSRVAIPRGELIFKERGHANALYRVVSGAVALWHVRPNGRRHIVDFRLPGEFFGAVYRPDYPVTAEAASDTVLIAYKRGQMDDICDAMPSFRRTMTAMIAEPIVSSRRAAVAERQTAKERIVEFLLTASVRASDAGDISIPVSDKDIADHVDLPREMVVRALHDLEQAGALALPGANAVVVKDLTRLQQFA